MRRRWVVVAARASASGTAAIAPASLLAAQAVRLAERARTPPTPAVRLSISRNSARLVAASVVT